MSGDSCDITSLFRIIDCQSNGTPNTKSVLPPCKPAQIAHRPVTDVTCQSLTKLAFVPDASFASFAAASGFALAQTVYGAGWPLFVNNDGAVEQWTISKDWGVNGSVAANAVAVKVIAFVSLFLDDRQLTRGKFSRSSRIAFRFRQSSFQME